MSNEEEDKTVYNVVINDELQYSIWPDWKENAPGWKNEGFSGSKKEVMEYIDKVWTDMRPLSLRKQMEEWEKTQPKRKPLTQADLDKLMTGKNTFNAPQPPNALVKKLMTDQSVEIIRYRNPKTKVPDPELLVDHIKRHQYVLIKFTGTQGGTELGLNLAPLSDRPTYSKCVFDEPAAGHVTLTGRVILDYCPILVHAVIDIQNFSGRARVEPCEPWETK